MENSDLYDVLEYKSLFSILTSFCKVTKSDFGKPTSSSFSNKVLRVIGLLQSLRNSSSSLKSFGNSPNRLFKNSSAETGFPSALQNEVETMCCISLSFPFPNLIFIFCLRSVSVGSLGSLGLYSPLGSFTPLGSSPKDSPSHSGSEKCL